ncbi:MAG: DUF2062 domain-containing protein [Sedimentisphaerales bacterium]|nr:DUF2062 domain-containing protein [Sedimentisphaerales bacterium]
MYPPRRTRGMWERFKRFIKLRILHVSDSPHRIALGVAIGVFVGWTPIIGPHMIMALALCALLRANKLVGVASVWISNPFTFGIIYGPSYIVGRAVVGFWRGSKIVVRDEWQDILHKMDTLGSIFTNFHRAAFWRELFDMLLKIGLELWIGCLIVGFVAAVAGYFLTRGFVVWHRRRNPRRRHTQL